MAIGRHHQAVIDTAGNALIGASVLVNNVDGTTATLYTDETGATGAANPVNYLPSAAGKTGLDARGNLTFYATATAAGTRYQVVTTPAGGTAQPAVDVWVVAAEPADPDLVTIAAIDSTVPGALVTDGAGWIRKTYAQLKTALGLVKADVGLANVDNTSDVAKPVSTAQQTALNAKANLVSGVVPSAELAATGTADTTTVLHGDRVWRVPPGGSLTIQEEGTALATAATTLNFVGGGVTAAGTTATKTITVLPVQADGTGLAVGTVFVGSDDVVSTGESVFDGGGASVNYAKGWRLSGGNATTAAASYIETIHAGDA